MPIRKKAFVPTDALQRYMDVQLQKPDNKDPDLHALSRLDEQMSQILFDPAYTTETKVKLYHDLLRRYRATDALVSTNFNQPVPVAVTNVPDQVDPAPVDAVLAQPVQTFPHQKPSLLRALDYIGKTRRSNAAMLIDFLVQHPGISWTDDYKLQLQGRVYQNSNMLDLIKEFMRDRARKNAMPPLGVGDLAKVMAGANVPRDAVLNKDIKDIMFDGPANLESSPYAAHLFGQPGSSASGRRTLTFDQSTPRRGRGIKWKSY